MQTTRCTDPGELTSTVRRALRLVAGIAVALALSACGGEGDGPPGGGDVPDAGDGDGPDAGPPPLTCDGCVGSGGACLTGDNPDACGSGGDACEDCAPGTACEDGHCVATACGPDDCDGCCSGDTCLAGDSAAACGNGGDQCNDCGVGFECEVGSCEIVPGSRWDLTVLSAQVSDKNTEGKSWDVFNGKPDVFAGVVVGSEPDEINARTSTLDNTFTPVWNQMIREDVTADRFLDHLFVVVKDSDVGSDQLIGQCAAAIDSFSFEAGAEVTIECPRDVGENQAGFVLTLQLTPH